jgi:hypothetical protein
MNNNFLTDKQKIAAAKRIILKVYKEFPNNAYTQNALSAIVQGVAPGRLAWIAVNELLVSGKIVLEGENFKIK